jgi:hypothetical protein
MVKSDEHMERIRTKLVDEAYVLFPSRNPYMVHGSDVLDKESRNPKLQRDSEISRSTESRFRFRRSSRERWRKSPSRTDYRVSRGVSSPDPGHQLARGGKSS